MQSGFSNTNTVPLWDFSHPQSFSQLPDDDFLALLQKQFPTTASGGYDDPAVSLGGGHGHHFGGVPVTNPFHADGVSAAGGIGAYGGIDPQSISTTHFPMADFADPPSEDSSPSPPGTSVQDSSAPRSRRDSTIEIDADEGASFSSNKRKVDEDDEDFDEGPSTKHAGV
jgi:AP-1-like transcription factor